MGKGSWSIEILVGLLIAVFILVVFVPMIGRVAAEVWNSLLQALGVIKPTNIEKAILCSYYRCVEGCNSPKMEEITWTDYNITKNKMEPRSCQDFCRLPCTEANVGECYTDTDDFTVCEDKSEKFPVKVTIKDAETIEKSHLKISVSSPVSIDVDCILPSDAKGPDTFNDFLKSLLSPLSSYWNSLARSLGITWGALIGSFERNWLIVDSSLIKSRGTESDCIEPLDGKTVTHESVDSLSLKKNNTIYIKTGYQNLGWGKIKFVTTQVMSNKTYTQYSCGNYLIQNDCESSTLDCKWCPRCSGNQENQFGKDMCIAQTDECIYRKSCHCYNEEDCGKDADCLFCPVPAPSLNRCLDKSEAWICI